MGLPLVLLNRWRRGSGVPANAIRDRANEPILDRAGNYIEVRA